MKPILFLDFDNTITKGDVLDRVIERYSASEQWREWEAAWTQGRISTHECLERQMGDLRVARDDLMAFMDTIELDPGFAKMVAWARANDVELRIVSDNFVPLIEEILRHRGIAGVPVFANALGFRGDRVEASFPFRDPACPRCAHCKAVHLRPITDRSRVYVGDGLSDLCPALIADRVFAKDCLARELAKRGKAFEPFADLGAVLQAVRKRFESA